MSDRRLLPQTLDGKLDHVIEECAEVTKAVIKGRRFGWATHVHEGITYNNMTDLFAEMRDLHLALHRLEVEMGAP